MNESEAIIERIERINSHYQHIELAVEDYLSTIKPGQSLLVRVGEDWVPYLRQRWWPVNVNKGRLIVERPIEEEYDTGQIVSVMGPLGQPFRFRRTLRNVLLIAYETPPTPLLMTIPWLLGNKISVTIVLVGNASSYDTQHLSPEVEVVHGDEAFNWSDQVMTVGWADQVFAVVAQDDEARRFYTVLSRFRERRADVPKNYLFGVFQASTACGEGACHACMIRTNQNTSLVCIEGPAYDLTQVKLV